MRYIYWWKERYSDMLNASSSVRKTLAKEVEILDDEMQSRYDRIHGEDGLCPALVEIFNAMAELRMKAEYGDYLAYACTALKGENIKDIIWKTERLDWQAVAKRILEEKSTLAKEKLRHLAITPTPYLNDISRAANRLGCESSMVRYQIIAYAQRNNFCHSGIKAIDFRELAERIMEDKRALDVIFRNRPHAPKEMRGLIKMVEREWFSRIWVDDTWKQRQVNYFPTEKALQKLRNIAPPEEPVQ